MSGFDEFERKEQEAANAIKVDSGLYQYLTEEIIESYLPITFQIGQLEGDFIGAFNAMVKDTGITVKDEYVKQLWENQKPVPGVDLRSGEYGKDYAGAGFFNAGVQFYDKGDIAAALRNFEKAIELCPHNIFARAFKVKIHCEDGDLWLAAAESENAILLNPVSIAEKDSESMKILEKYPASFREIMEEYLAMAYFYRATIYHNLHRNEEALADLNEAIKREPDNLEVMSWRQTIYMALERWEDAVTNADTLIAAGYDLEKIYQYRGISLKAMDRHWEALDDFNAALNLNPGLTYAYLQRAECNYHESFFEDAIKDATIAIEKSLPYAHHYRGEAYFGCGEFTKAIADFEESLKEYPNDEACKGDRKQAVEFREGGMAATYHRQNEKGEWEQVSKKDGEVESIIPSPTYQRFLDECRMEEAVENGWKLWNWEKKIREPAVETGKRR